MNGAVVALAGRRIDAPNADPSRFPLENADAVGERIRGLLVDLDALVLVSSAACGADLLALEAAGNLGLRRVVVLPFAAERFRVQSVTDRPGGEERWGKTFDRVLSEIPSADVIVLDAVEGDAAFAMANQRIVYEARDIARALGLSAVAVIVWDGTTRGKTDLTAQFAGKAAEQQMEVEELSTL